jgi:DHA1 family bicyclomycin/chloramphenicol resistance-like MFS transporter
MGRKPPLYIALAIFALGSILAAIAPNAGMLIAARVVQGFGAAALMVIPRAIVRDMARGTDATRLMALMMLVFSVSPMLAPLTGAGVSAIWGWRAVFVALLITTLAALAMLHFAQSETHPAHARTRATGLGMMLGAKTVLRDRAFVVLTALGAAGMTSFFLFLAAAPFVYTGFYGLSATEFALAFAVNAVSFIGAGQIAAPLGTRFGAISVMRGAAALFAAATAALFALTMTNAAPLPVFIGLLAAGNAGLGLIIPTSMVMALEDQGAHAGLASSLGGTFQMLLGGGIVALAGPILSNQPAPLAGMIAACAAVTLALSWFAKRG